jgi:DNA-binding CsgD family transcriptional regulator
LHLFNDDPHYTKLYFEKYLPMDPFFPAATFFDAGVVHASSDIVPQKELEKTRFYKEWIAPQGTLGALAVNLEKGAMRSSMINIRTDSSYGPVDGEARRRLALLVPHLQRAVAIGKLFDQEKATADALTETLDHVEAAVLLLGPGGSIAFANAPATAMLREATLISQQGNLLCAASTESDHKLLDAIAEAEKDDDSLSGQGVAVPLTDVSQQRWFAHVLPLTSGRRREAGAAYAAVAAVFIRQTNGNAPPPLETIAKLHKLTASEVRILDAMLRANGIKAIAEQLGLSQATVKTHLHKLFRKTGTRRQSELMKLVAGI